MNELRYEVEHCGIANNAVAIAKTEIFNRYGYRARDIIEFDEEPGSDYDTFRSCLHLSWSNIKTVIMMGFNDATD